MKAANSQWSKQYEEGVKAGKETPWMLLSGTTDPFRQGFYSVTSRLITTGYTHRVYAEMWRESLNTWVKVEFNTTRDAVKDHLKSLHARNARNIKAWKI